MRDLNGQDARSTIFRRSQNIQATGFSGCHWRWAWSVDGTPLYAAAHDETEKDYLLAANPEKAMNLAYGLDIEIEPINPNP